MLKVSKGFGASIFTVNKSWPFLRFSRRKRVILMKTWVVCMNLHSLAFVSF